RRATMNAKEKILEIARVGDAVVLTPRRDLRELEFVQIQEEIGAVADDPSVRRVVIDFGGTDSLGSTALGMLVRLGQAARRRAGPVRPVRARARDPAGDRPVRFLAHLRLAGRSPPGRRLSQAGVPAEAGTPARTASPDSCLSHAGRAR